MLQRFNDRFRTHFVIFGKPRSNNHRQNRQARRVRWGKAYHQQGH
ncbi:Uncharacterised protein [Vibrio cholerae]|nr:Uncharacterised protein [Vibrio cholerae]